MINIIVGASNKRLLKKYPFLRLRNAFTGKKLKGYNFTVLEFLPIGWRKAFAEDMCDDFKNAIKKSKARHFYIYGLKEKYGSLRIESSSYTDEIAEVIEKYENLSAKTCISCGKDGEMSCKFGWYEPLCSECGAKNKSKGFYK